MPHEQISHHSITDPSTLHLLAVADPAGGTHHADLAGRIAGHSRPGTSLVGTG
jgi:hypothetical protein